MQTFKVGDRVQFDPDANTKPTVKELSWHPQIDHTDPDRVYEVLSVSSTSIGGSSINIVPVDETLRALRPTGFYLEAKYLKKAKITFKVGDRVMLDPASERNQRNLRVEYPVLSYDTVYTIEAMHYDIADLADVPKEQKGVFLDRLMPAPVEVEEAKPKVPATLVFTCSCGEVHTLFTVPA